MVLSPWLFKAVLVTTIAGGAGTAASLAIYQSATQGNTGPTTNPIVLVKAKTQLIIESQLSVDSKEHSYKCKVSGDDSTPVFCSLVKLNLSKNWIDVNGIKKATSSGTVKLTDLNADGNHFKLEVNPTLYARVNLSEKKHIEIISTTTANKKLAKLNVSFKVSDAGFSYTTTNHLLGRAQSSSVTYNSSKDYQCPFISASTTSPTYACSIYPFGSTTAALTAPGYHKQQPTDLLKTKAADPLIKDQYYMLNYTHPSFNSALIANKSAYINKVENSTVSSSGSLSNLVPVIIRGKHNKKAFILSDTPSYSIIVKKDTALETNKTISHTTTDKNYKCKLDTSTPVDCELVDLGLSDTKTSIDIAGIKNADLTAPLSIQHSDTTVKFFKLDVPVATFNAIKYKLSASSTKIQIVDKDASSAKIADVTPLFAIDDDNVPYFQKSTFLVKNAVVTGEGIAVDGAFDASKTHYCSFSTTDSPSETPTKCELIDLGTGNLSATQEITATPTTTSITTQNNYLVKFTDTSGAETTLAKGSKDINNLFFVQEDVDGSNKKLVAKFNNQDIKEALVVEGKSSKKHLFIIG